MKEFRLTFTTDNFGAISQVLVDMGISFRVEPIEAAFAEAAPARASHPPAAKRRRSTKKTAKAGAVAKPARAEKPATRADRLREAMTRGRTTADQPPFGPPARTMDEESAGVSSPASPAEEENGQ